MGFKLKQKKGALHLGKGRFFYAGETYKEDAVPEQFQEKYFEKVEDEQTVTLYTQASLKKMNADKQKSIIVELAGDPEETNNEEERIALILKLQEEAQGE